MNSMSKKHFGCDDPCHKNHDDDCESSRKFHKETQVALKCGTPGSRTIASGVTLGVAIPITSLVVNTSCFCNPTVKLEFASNLVNAGAFVGTVNFQVNKICANQFTPTPIGSTFTFTGVDAITSETFSFFVCDCGTCFNDCCTYTVVATPVAITDGSLAVNNAELSALIVDNQNNCGC